MEQIEISNHKLSSLKRKLSVSKFEIDFELKEIHFYYIIYFFNSNGDSLDSFKEPLVGNKLTASNDMKVDERGNYLQSDENGLYPENAIGEFDFWLSFIQNSNFTYSQVFESVISKADSFNRFE